MSTEPTGAKSRRNDMEKRLAKQVPSHTLRGIKDYVEKRYPPGGFLMAVLSNDLKGAFGRADTWNLQAMQDIVRYLWNCTPASCWGSPENVQQWLEKDPHKD